MVQPRTSPASIGPPPGPCTLTAMLLPSPESKAKPADTAGAGCPTPVAVAICTGESAAASRRGCQRMGELCWRPSNRPDPAKLRYPLPSRSPMSKRHPIGLFTGSSARRIPALQTRLRSTSRSRRNRAGRGGKGDSYANRFERASMKGGEWPRPKIAGVNSRNFRPEAKRLHSSKSFVPAPTQNRNGEKRYYLHSPG